MRIIVAGVGYVGLVAGACFAEMGNHLVCVDTQESKLNHSRNWTIPVSPKEVKF